MLSPSATRSHFSRACSIAMRSPGGNAAPLRFPLSGYPCLRASSWIQDHSEGIFVGYRRSFSNNSLQTCIKNRSAGGGGGIRTLGPPQRGQRFSSSNSAVPPYTGLSRSVADFLGFWPMRPSCGLGLSHSVLSGPVAIPVAIRVATGPAARAGAARRWPNRSSSLGSKTAALKRPSNRGRLRRISQIGCPRNP